MASDSKIQGLASLSSPEKEFGTGSSVGSRIQKIFCGFPCSDSYRNRYRAWWSRLRSKVWWSRLRSKVWWSRLRSKVWWSRLRSKVWWSRLRSTTSDKIQNSILWFSVFPRFSGNLIQSFVHSWLKISPEVIYQYSKSSPVFHIIRN